MIRLLLISYYFPPCGGAAVQRWMKLLPELAKQDIEIHVLCSSGGDYPETDDTLLDAIPAQINIHRTPAPSMGKVWRMIFGDRKSMPYGNLGYQQSGSFLARMLIWIRLNLIIPDLRVFWNRRARLAALDILRGNHFDVIVTTGPPHSTHLIGMALKKSTGIRWIADWRDPWSGVYYFRLSPPSALSMWFHRLLEAKVCRTADLNITVSRHLAKTLPCDNTMVLYNGYDAGAYPNSRECTLDNVFRIKYVGRITAGQDANALLAVLKQVCGDMPVQLSFVGTVLSDVFLSKLREIPDLELRVIPFVPYRQALSEMSHSDLLLLLINDYPGHEGMLTSKLFEYIGAGRPVLGLGPRGGEAEEILIQYGAGQYFSYAETALAAEFVSTLIQNKTANEVWDNNADIAALSSQSQALRLWEMLSKQKK